VCDVLKKNAGPGGGFPLGGVSSYCLMSWWCVEGGGGVYGDGGSTSGKELSGEKKTADRESLLETIVAQEKKTHPEVWRMAGASEISVRSCGKRTDTCRFRKKRHRVVGEKLIRSLKTARKLR